MLALVYVAGWLACMAGQDGRYTNPHPRRSEAAFAWDSGFLDAMESEDGEQPQPAAQGYGEAR